MNKKGYYFSTLLLIINICLGCQKKYNSLVTDSPSIQLAGLPGQKVTYGLDYSKFDIQDHYSLRSNWGIKGKWEDVKAQVDKANTNQGETFFMNYLSASGGGFPYFFASGKSSHQDGAPQLCTGRIAFSATEEGLSEVFSKMHISPCPCLYPVAFEGINRAMLKMLRSTTGLKHLGMIMMDFPGIDLIGQIISCNTFISPRDNTVTYPNSLDGAYTHEAAYPHNNPSWMATISDETPLSQLSIPGTHDTMARHGGDITQTQSCLLSTQLEGGIRAIDIRTKMRGGQFKIYHGIISQEAEFGEDVLTPIKAFLEQNKSEVVLMRISDRDSGNTTDTERAKFCEKLNGYIGTYQDFFWKKNNNSNPTLGEVRGKIVILQDFQQPK